MKIETDFLIIGAGQAGLAIAYFLQQKNKKFLLVDKNNRIGDSWRNRYDSLLLFTPRIDDCLPGLVMSGDPERCPTKDELSNYLEKYAAHYKFPVKINTNIEKLSKEDNLFIAEASSVIIKAKNVIVATGAFQKPFIPVSYNLPSTIFQVHSADYRNPHQIPQRSVLIVGGGHSGIQIAAELSSTHKVTMVTKRKMIFSNKYDIFYMLLSKIISTETIHRLVDFAGIRKIYTPEIVSLINEGKVHVKKKIDKVEGNNVYFSDGTNSNYDNVIWATGFIFDYNWIQIPQVFDKNGNINEKNGVANVKGLYFVYPKIDYGFIKDLVPKAEKLVNNMLES